MSINSKILLDSVNIFGNRLTTVIATFPRCILSEINTHKMISKNSASSRAIPFHKMLENVEKNPFIPIKWMKDHSGMQGVEYFTNEEVESIGLLRDHLEARDFAMERAIKQNSNGLTKQIVNRLLEPFLWHKTLLSGTEFENFFALRAEGMAEIHLQALAYDMLDKFNNSTPTLVKSGEWHIPYGNNIDERELRAIAEVDGYKLDSNGYIIENEQDILIKYKLKISTARNARTSYDNFDGTSDIAKDIVMAEERIIKPGHWSPTEHPARAMSEEEFYNHSKTFTILKSEVEAYEAKNNSDWYEVVAYTKDGAVITEFGWSKNVRGWLQYRSLFQNENRTEPRLIKR